jgi:hypothetical protein
VQLAASGAQFWRAASDGSKAIYTLGDFGGGKGELYEFDLGSKSSTLIAKGVPGVTGASEDLSRLYFVSSEALAGGAQAGKPNLYLREGGSPLRLVATLASSDLDSLSKFGFSAVNAKPIKRGVRTTADGGRLAFVSRAPLTGYDNKDVGDGTAELELYVYDVGTNQLHCISCNPSGARPAGRKFKDGPAELRVAAMMAPADNELDSPHDLSADGSRLFFESFEALVPRDGNGKGDVYEWEQAESQAACEAIGAELFVASAGGCLSLISSGQSPSDSEFLDASASGSDAFFKTGSSLLPQDPGLVDIYDARVNGGLPTPPPSTVPCEGEACQSPAAAPEDSTPSSSVARPGNVPAQGASSRCPKGKHKVKKNGKYKCVKKKKGGSRRSKRHHGSGGAHK